MQTRIEASTLENARAGRILAPDLARGMMLLFIAVANVSAYLWGRSTPGFSTHPSGEEGLDSALTAFVMLFIDGHVYPMFAFLFGYGITQFAYSRIDRGVPAGEVGRMLLRRHLWLLAFGAVHALLLFAGDILGAYALTGLALAPLLLRAGDRVIRVLLWTLGGICVGIALLAASAMLLLDAILPATMLQTAPGLDAEQSGFDAMLTAPADLMNGVSNYWLAMLGRLGLWAVSSIGAVLSLIVPFAVLLGGYAARHRWLEGLTRRLSLRAVALCGIAVSLLGSVPVTLGYLGVWPQGELSSYGWLIVSQACGIAGGIGYAALFALLGLRFGAAPGGAVRAIAAVGKRSLSFYLLQSLVFAPLIAAWGFGLGERIGSATAYLIALAVWLLSIGLAAWLERSGRRGPAEVLLRRLSRS